MGRSYRIAEHAVYTTSEGCKSDLGSSVGKAETAADEAIPEGAVATSETVSAEGAEEAEKKPAEEKPAEEAAAA